MSEKEIIEMLQEYMDKNEIISLEISIDPAFQTHTYVLTWDIVISKKYKK